MIYQLDGARSLLLERPDHADVDRWRIIIERSDKRDVILFVGPFAYQLAHGMMAEIIRQIGDDLLEPIRIEVRE